VTPDQAQERLEAERDRLEHVRATFDGEHLRDETAEASASELTHFDQHQADAGSETFEREKDLSILTQVEVELHDVEYALGRLDAGTYGTCEECGEPIPDERLEVVPAARFCVTHQHQAEHLRPSGD
jgi:RNA polymerase-binding transcription factor DksA